MGIGLRDFQLMLLILTIYLKTLSRLFLIDFLCVAWEMQDDRYMGGPRPAMRYEIWRLMYLLRTSRAPGERSCARSHFRELRQKAANLEIRKGMVVDVTKLSYVCCK